MESAKTDGSRRSRKEPGFVLQTLTSLFIKGKLFGAEATMVIMGCSSKRETISWPLPRWSMLVLAAKNSLIS